MVYGEAAATGVVEAGGDGDPWMLWCPFGDVDPGFYSARSGPLSSDFVVPIPRRRYLDLVVTLRRRCRWILWRRFGTLILGSGGARSGTSTRGFKWCWFGDANFWILWSPCGDVDLWILWRHVEAPRSTATQCWATTRRGSHLRRPVATHIGRHEDTCRQITLAWGPTSRLPHAGTIPQTGPSSSARARATAAPAWPARAVSVQGAPRLPDAG
jgi:hypothetical protein